MNDRFLIICKDDEGRYRLVTRQTFNSEEEAKQRASGIAPSRQPIIVACDDRTVVLRKEEL